MLAMKMRDECSDVTFVINSMQVCCATALQKALR